MRVLPAVPLFWVFAAGLAQLSLAGAYVWLRGSNVATSRRRLWLMSCALLGMPALLSMLCLERRG